MLEKEGMKELHISALLLTVLGVILFTHVHSNATGGMYNNEKKSHLASKIQNNGTSIINRETACQQSHTPVTLILQQVGLSADGGWEGEHKMFQVEALKTNFLTSPAVSSSVNHTT